MPIAVPLAIVGSAAIGAAASSSSANRTARAAERTATTNNDLQREVYNRNTSNMQPYMEGGNRAFSAWQDFMGLTPRAASPAPSQSTMTAGWMPGNGAGTGPVGINGARAMADTSMGPQQREMMDGGGYNALMPTNALGGGPDGPQVMPQEPGAPQVLPGQLGVAGSGNALSGYDQFKASTGYETGLAEGYRGLNARLANSGRLQSGDAGREAIRYGQNYANTFANGWLDRLMQGTQVGTGAANALAGVGSNYASAVGANNNNALNATANANASNADAITGLAGNAGSAAAYYYGNRSAPTASSYAPTASGSGRPIYWG